MLCSTNLFDIANGLADALKLDGEVLYLAKFYAEATQLYLSIVSSKNFHIAVRLPTCQVARSVNPDTLILHEALLRHLRQVIIASCHTRTSDE